MADIVTSTAYLSVKFPLVRDGEESSRSITLPNPTDNMMALGTFKEQFLTAFAQIDGYEYLFQPTNWRDDNDEDSAWGLDSSKSIEFEVVQTTRTKLE